MAQINDQLCSTPDDASWDQANALLMSYPGWDGYPPATAGEQSAIRSYDCQSQSTDADAEAASLDGDGSDPEEQDESAGKKKADKKKKKKAKKQTSDVEEGYSVAGQA